MLLQMSTMRRDPNEFAQIELKKHRHHQHDGWKLHDSCKLCNQQSHGMVARADKVHLWLP